MNGYFSKTLFIQISSRLIWLVGQSLLTPGLQRYSFNLSQTSLSTTGIRDRRDTAGLGHQIAYYRMGEASGGLGRDPTRNIIKENAIQTVTTLGQSLGHVQIGQKEGNTSFWEGGLGKETREMSGLRLQRVLGHSKVSGFYFFYFFGKGKLQEFLKQRCDHIYIYKGGKHWDMQDELASLAG